MSMGAGAFLLCLEMIFILDHKNFSFIVPHPARVPQAPWSHGHLLRTAYKLSATKIEHSHWSTGHSTHL